MEIRLTSIVICILAAAVLLLTPTDKVSASDESDVRAAIQRVFNQLKSGQYDALYDGLPSSFRGRIAKDRFINGLQRTQNIYRLDRIEVGAVHASGNIAVADTTMYGHVTQPFEADGKIIVQQYLVREDNQWRVATGDNATINRFIHANPAFARRFPIRRPRAFVNQNGKWTEVPLGRR